MRIERIEKMKRIKGRNIGEKKRALHNGAIAPLCNAGFTGRLIPHQKTTDLPVVTPHSGSSVRDVRPEETYQR